jgi:hypothetical protein
MISVMIPFVTSFILFISFIYLDWDLSPTIIGK